MRILQATSWLSRLGGGVPPVVKGISKAQAARGHEVVVAGLDDPHALQDTKDWGVPVRLGRVVGPAMFGFSLELGRFFDGECGLFDVAHCHGLWMWPGRQTRVSAQANKIPLIISPHGMMDSWAMKRSRWKKVIARWIFEDANFRAAACFHALCDSEYESVRALGLKNPVAVIPNGIDLAEYENLPPRESLRGLIPELGERKALLFLARMHPKKGLPHLIKAWASLGPTRSEWALLVAGPDQLGHTEEMKTLAKDLGVEGSVFFPGPLYGVDKLAAMAGSDAFVLPSFSEGFSMAVLEAASCRLPLLLTRQCNFPEMAAAGGSVEFEPTEKDTARALEELFEMSDAAREAMGRNARSLVEEKYSWDEVAREIINVYEWTRGFASQPASVRMD